MKTLHILIGLLLLNIVHGQSKLEFFHVECEEGFDEEKFEYIDRIKEVNWLDNTLIISLAKFEDCAFSDSQGEFEIIGDTIFLSYVQTDVYLARERGDTNHLKIYSFCDCPLSFEYKISGLEKKDYIFYLNGSLFLLNKNRFKTYPISFMIDNNDTINYQDKYRLRQGFWIETDSVNNKNNDSIKWMRMETNYIDNDFTNGKTFWYRPDSTIAVVSTFFTTDSVKVEFFNNKEHKYKVEYYKDFKKYRTDSLK